MSKTMAVAAAICQLRTTDLEAAERFYVDVLGFELQFRVEDFYAGVAAGTSVIHLKRVDDVDPSIAYVHEGEHLHIYFQVNDALQYFQTISARGATIERGPMTTDYAVHEFVVRDGDGHTLYFSEASA